MSNVGLQVRKAVPTIDPVVQDYAVGYVQHVSNNTEDSVTAQQTDIGKELGFIEELLLDAGGKEGDVQKLISALTEELSKKLKDNMAKLEITGDRSKRLLDVNVLQKNTKRDINSSLALLGSSRDITHAGRQIESKVDVKKLEKQERKIAKRWPRETTSLSNTRLRSC